jgi:hypothetical protein
MIALDTGEAEKANDRQFRSPIAYRASKLRGAGDFFVVLFRTGDSYITSLIVR